MRSAAMAVALFAVCLQSSAATAQDAAGHWAVAGNVEGKSFTLDCMFVQSGHTLSGSCTDGPTGDARVEGGRSHALLDGHADGDQVEWTYQSSYLFIKFDVKYAGKREGDQMTGTISAAGKTGTFTATRAPS